MKAAYYIGNKDFSLREADSLTPATGEVQVKVAYCGICGTDLHVYLGHMDARVGNNRIIGHEMSGTIESIGDGVENLEIGDPVVIRPLSPCGNCPACERGHSHICQKLKFLGLDTDGAFQENWTVPAYTVHKLPADMSLKHAALIEPLAVACHDVTRSRLQSGEDVLVIGGGPIGMLVAMVARKQGGNVVISEVSEHRLVTAEKMGFKTLNPLQVNVAEAIHKATGDKGADVVFEVSGSQPGVDTMTEACAARARIVMVAIHATKPQVDLFKFFWREIEMLGARVYQPDDFEQAIQMISSGAIDCDTMITDVQELSDIQNAFVALSSNPQAMKSLIKCS